MSKLHIFDMDGTILEGSACVHLSDRLGCLKEIHIIEEAWGRGEVGHVEFYRLCLPLWKELNREIVKDVFQKSPWRKNLSKVFCDIADRGEYSAVITLSPQFFAEHLKELGVSSTHGAEIHVDRPLESEKVLTPEHKVSIAQALLQEYGIPRSQCVAYGDSASDIPLFAHLANTVAVNASDRLKQLAAANYSGDDLWEAYKLGRTLLEPRLVVPEPTRVGQGKK